MKKLLTLLFISSAGTYVAFAQQTQQAVNGTALLSLLGLAQELVNRLTPFLVGVAVLAFFYFLVMLIIKGGKSADGKEGALKGMGYSLLALFVMVSVWGIIGFFGNLLGVGQGGTVPVPYVTPCKPPATTC